LHSTRVMYCKMHSTQLQSLEGPMNRLSEPMEGLVFVPIAIQVWLYGVFTGSDPEVSMEFETD
jgi:hypothetical protein